MNRFEITLVAKVGEKKKPTDPDVVDGWLAPDPPTFVDAQSSYIAREIACTHFSRGVDQVQLRGVATNGAAPPPRSIRLERDQFGVRPVPLAEMVDSNGQAKKEQLGDLVERALGLYRGNEQQLLDALDKVLRPYRQQKRK
jgi:hypothetical protein